MNEKQIDDLAAQVAMDITAGIVQNIRQHEGGANVAWTWRDPSRSESRTGSRS